MDKKKAYAICVLFMIIGVAAEVVCDHGGYEVPAWWPLPYGLSAGMGFLGCWVLIIVAKLIMAPLLQREPDYYNEGGEEDD
ncbi:MAG: hypothetical protein Q4D07_06520 [Selenomonadaceae bacterium]|nr:hypothetical protein [Selenomonadaceae bacterium]